MLRRIVPCLAVLLAPLTASAANGNKPRIPVVWSAAECGTVVDRSTTAVAHFEYTVPMEDVPEMRTADEVDDSRTHQFFAFRKLDFASANSPDKLPRWITQADIDRAAMVDPMVVSMVTAGIPTEEILENDTRFVAGDWVRITADDARVPISNAQAALGVDWDVSAIEPGAWTVWGYTWDPILNLWSARPGFVKIIASAAEADAAGPAIALLPEDAQLVGGEAHALAGCVDAPEGSTLTIEWGAVVGSVEPEWHALVEDEPITTGALDLEITLPNEAADDMSLVKLRATVSDPAGKQYVAYSPGSYSVMPGKDDGGGGCSVGRAGSFGWLVCMGFAMRRRRRASAS